MRTVHDAPGTNVVPKQSPALPDWSEKSLSSECSEMVPVFLGPAFERVNDWVALE
jgi:hypothetical protein